MSLAGMLTSEEGRSLLLATPARGLLHGALRVDEEEGGWVRPLRFLPAQRHALGNCQAWHPGLYRQAALATAGITLEFETNASELALELTVDPEPTGTRSLLSRAGLLAEQTLDGVSCVVDGRPLAPSWGELLPAALSGRRDEAPDAREQTARAGRAIVVGRLPRSSSRLVSFDLEDPSEGLDAGVRPLLGFGASHRVSLYLPALRGCTLRTLWSDGTECTATAPRGRLLVLGDGLAQGLATGDPAQSWPARLARELGCDLVNQGLVGQVFQPGTLAGMGELADVAAVVVAFGATYRHEPCAARPVARDVRSYLLELSRTWPAAPTFVLTPLPHEEAVSPTHPKSCAADLPLMLAANVAAHDQMRLVEGHDLLRAEKDAFADGGELLSAAGARRVARRLGRTLGKEL